MGKFTRADDDMIEFVERVRERWHPDLEYARIGVLMRAEAQVKKGMVVLGQAKKASDTERLLSREDLDFILIFAADQWNGFLTDEQKLALVDHELCHCSMSGDKAGIRPHDFEEFDAVIRRHGAWWPGAETTIEAMQPHFAFMGDMGRVEALDPTPFNDRDVLEQVDGMMHAQPGQEEVDE